MVLRFLCISSILFAYKRLKGVFLIHQILLMMKSIVTLFALFFLSVSALAEVSNAEKKALLEFNTAANGAQWINKWDITKPVSTWYGVSVVNDKVVGINLSDNNLTGFLTPHLCDLKNLQVLVLFKNKLEGELPIAIGQLKNLQVLDVSFNQISGRIPSDIAGAVALRELILFMNNFSGPIPDSIGALTHLEVVSLYNNRLTGQLPATIYSLKGLRILELNSNELEGSLTPEIANLTALQTLSLFDNRLNGSVPFEIEAMPNLTAMNISYNKFNGFVSKKMYTKDQMNMTMINEQGLAVNLAIKADSTSAIAEEE